jgi:hypothetical protein
MDIDQRTFDEQRSPRFGRSNPERMRLEFWEAMVKLGRGPYAIRERFDSSHDVRTIWCFDRMGQTRVEMADGRTICVAGEYEDGGDPDFCIYNDVVVLLADGGVEIYGYPKEDFPPTDFHTASLVGGRIVLIGSLGYQEERTANQGESPGWLHKHEAEVSPEGDSILIRGGLVLEIQDDDQVFRENLEEYRFRPDDGLWERLTDRRGWRQFLINRLDGACLDDILCSALPEASGDHGFWFYPFKESVFRPRDVPHDVLTTSDENSHRRYDLMIEGVRVRFYYELDLMRMVVEGELPGSGARRIAESIRANIQEAISQPCRLLEF